MRWSKGGWVPLAFEPDGDSWFHEPELRRGQRAEQRIHW